MSKKIVPTLGHSTFRFNEQFLDDRPPGGGPGRPDASPPADLRGLSD